MTGSEPETDRVAETLSHLQAAALEMIAALRSTLDLAEDLVRDPPLPAADIVQLVTEVVHAVQPLVSPSRQEANAPASPVERIRVS